MRGILIHYNEQSRQGLIRAEDGRRYAFMLDQWRAESPPIVGDDLDFETEGTLALDIYVAKPAAPPPPPQYAPRPRERGAPPPRDSLGPDPVARAPRGAPPPRERAPETGDAPAAPGFGTRLVSHWTAILALVALLGCMMPYVSVGGQFGFGSNSSSLLGIGNLGSQMLKVLDTGRQFERAFSPQRPQNVQQQREREKIESLRWKVWISYVLYIVPLLALAVIVVQGIGWRANSLTVTQALTAIAIPIAVPLIYYALVHAEVPQPQRQNIPDILKLLNFSFTGIGFWVMVLAGVLQLLNVMGLFRKGPGELFGGMAAVSASSAPRRGPPAQYNEPRHDERPRQEPRYRDEPPPPRPGAGNRRPPPSRDGL